MIQLMISLKWIILLINQIQRLVSDLGQYLNQLNACLCNRPAILRRVMSARNSIQHKSHISFAIYIKGFIQWFYLVEQVKVRTTSRV